MTRRSLSIGALVAAVALAVFWYVGAHRTPPLDFRGPALPHPYAAPDFTLTDQDGHPFRLSSLRGEVVLLFFGYTHCPDVCPTTLANFRRVHELLGADARDVRFVFVTVDPARDHPSDIKRYLQLFGTVGDEFIGLSGSQADLKGVFQRYGVWVDILGDPKKTANYAVAHSANTYVIDRQGRIRLEYPWNPKEIDGLAHDVRLLVTSS